MRLICYALHGDTPEIVPAPPEREWMDKFSGRHPYRCLPLAIANCYGWQLLLQETVEATWNGGPSTADLIVSTQRQHTAVSNFGRGVLTFDVPFIFRTQPGYHILTSGPTNEFKDGAAPMTAVVETDWLPYTFTMNYQFTRPGTVTWEKGSAYCQFSVIPAGFQETVEPEIRRITENAELLHEHKAWARERTEFRARQDQGDSVALKQAWQRFYFKGQYTDGRAAPSHQSKMRLREVPKQ